MKIHALVAALLAVMAPVIGHAHEWNQHTKTTSFFVYQPPAAVATGLPTAITTGALNLREGPGVSYRKISVLHRNTNVHIHGCSPSGNWCHVSSATVTGWVSARYLSRTPAPVQPPVHAGTWPYVYPYPSVAPYPYTSVVPYPYMAMPRVPGTSTIIYTRP